MIDSIGIIKYYWTYQFRFLKETAMIVEVKELCRALDLATLVGSQEDWGERSQRLFQLYRRLSKHLGDQVVTIADESTDAIVAAIRGLELTTEEVETLSVLHRSLSAPARPLTLLVTLGVVGSP